ncbi:cobyrinic acid a,c-diamide synthase [Citromicrobium sp. RCC1885]|uniref:cobyrinate a,c-diamide synthase n=1 Tax=unclassified Citromicrobium TaxID=2630544 RepID=UPI0006C90A6F|nr:MULTISPECIES: cobyrinate a,c-diamide synthase [unclassified Citromicrobium]KPM22625.1 cobyrinic acid a,c-diamide synthase [Citromicrobium sp. RCC1885]KPM26108.1 cobyrinic acid a,c-diamide synthase [Citromicrobium sp. RCC1878]MAO03803.1 cobyrinate a,c-diamide synthase [Citromicrobium sp.]OAM07797.1 cobyrinic acid a,c-diamide synthase [Citromicrobium sp. RCC1897]
MTGSASCPALLVAAPASGQGKTTITAALARRYRDRGLRVRVFKCGPDFLDPMILKRASGHPVLSLDLFMVGEDDCRRLLYEAACEADIILVEGVMGLFDGDPSAADIAARFGLPVLAVIDGSAMAQSFGAIVHGLATYRSDIALHGAIANRVGSARHAAMLEDSVRPPVRWLGAVERSAEFALPERHLGLLMADEIAGLDERIAACARGLPDEVDQLPPPVTFSPGADYAALPADLEGQRIAIARDACFAFIYPDNLAVLRELGADLHFFSPLAGDPLPDCDALWLPGGYPELHAEALAENPAFFDALRAHHELGKPILAECGGMMVCAQELETIDGQTHVMAGLMPGRTIMQSRLGGLGLQECPWPGGTLRGHGFHYSRIETDLAPFAQTGNPNGGRSEALFVHGSMRASYVHSYFRSNIAAAASLFRITE